MLKSLKALSALLTYPTLELQQACGEISEVLEKETAIPSGQRGQLYKLLTELATGDLYDLQERYVMLFDRTRSLSLHLFEHVHGESRDRGQAMIDLKTQYEQHNLFMSAAELPDFLPLFLEYLSVLPAAEACETLGQPAHIFAAMAERLRKRKSAYEAVFRVLVALATAKPKDSEVSALLELPDPEAYDLAALDAAWEDQPVNFGPVAGDGCKDGLIARIRGGLRPAPDMPPANPTRAVPPRQ
ncbi:MAG: nitrate reductase molybdenum cofactor assembly chaperone [Rhizobiales bacterium]|nr:nitrate reductase molybdenum cofactor assembly chaperone [Hyphomicrobiales bacterium]